MKAVEKVIVNHHLEFRTTIFAFPKVGRKFNWKEARVVPLGIIEPLPWRISEVAEKLKPDAIMMGWGSNWAKYTYYIERLLFQISCRVARRALMSKNMPKLIVGSLRTPEEFLWAEKQRIFFAGIVDLSYL